jgi:hypothetical protein
LSKYQSKKFLKLLADLPENPKVLSNRLNRLSRAFRAAMLRARASRRKVMP